MIDCGKMIASGKHSSLLTLSVIDGKKVLCFWFELECLICLGKKTLVC
jgi:hypothetical protein